MSKTYETVAQIMMERDQLRAELAALKAGHGKVVAWVHPNYLAQGMEGWAFEASRVRLSPLQVPLYTDPPVPVDARLVPVELLERLIKCYEDGMSIYGECEELCALLAQSESKGVKS